MPGEDEKGAWLSQQVETINLDGYWGKKITELLGKNTWTSENFYEAFYEIFEKFHQTLIQKAVERGILTEKEAVSAHEKWLSLRQ